MKNELYDVRGAGGNCGQCRGHGDCALRGLGWDEECEPCPSFSSDAYERGSFLFRSGERVRSLAILKSGSVKLCIYDDDGTEQIVGFRQAGDLLDPVGLGDRFYRHHGIALETTSVCRVPLTALDELSQRTPQMWARIVAAVAAETGEYDMHTLVIAQRPARARLAWFLRLLASAYARRGFSGAAFNLSMSRYDISNYLAMAVETVSRLLSDFSRNGIIDVSGRLITIRDADALAALAGVVPEAEVSVRRVG